MALDVPPTVYVTMPPGREYEPLLIQTKTVYDQLLGNKHAQLVQELVQKKAAYDRRAAELTDPGQAREFGRKAQEAINQLQRELQEEMAGIQEDYQRKMNHMAYSTEKRWKEEKENGPDVQCTIYKHK